MNKWIDLTNLLDANYIPFPGDEKLSMKKVKNIDIDGYNMHRIETGMHIGTHIDARSHIMEN